MNSLLKLRGLVTLENHEHQRLLTLYHWRHWFQSQEREKASGLNQYSTLWESLCTERGLLAPKSMNREMQGSTAFYPIKIFKYIVTIGFH